MKYYTYLQLANTPYGGDVYGSETYSGTASEVTPVTSEPTPAAPGGLANTGFDILIPIALGVAIILAAVVMLVRMHSPKAKKNRQ